MHAAKRTVRTGSRWKTISLPANAPESARGAVLPALDAAVRVAPRRADRLGRKP